MIDRLPERLRSKIVVDGECWLWCAAVGTHGYGVVRDVENGRLALAHRFVYELLVGPIPVGRQIDHYACGVRRCVNPAHVRPVTPRENQLRSDTLASRNLARTSCPQQHAYDERNTGRRTDGSRYCRRCARDRQRQRRLSS